MASPEVTPKSPIITVTGTRKQLDHVAPLSIVPGVYSEEDFRLENPRTFDVVSERSDVFRPMSGASVEDQTKEDQIEANGSAFPTSVPARKSLATNAILQEKLSWYMDTVELHLISSISAASTTFFAALGSLKELYSEAERSVKRIQELRVELQKLDKDMAGNGLEIIGLRRRKDNLRKLGDTVKQLKQLIDGVTQTHELIENGHIHDAMEIVEEVENLLEGRGTVGFHDPSLVDLRRIHVTEAISNDLKVFRVRIGKAYEALFVDALIEDLRRHLRNVHARKTLDRWNSMMQRPRGGHTRTISGPSAQETLVDTLREQLQPSLKGLGRCSNTDSAAAAYRDAALREIKNLIRSHLPSSDDDDAQSVASSSAYGDRKRTQQEKSSILARNLRALEPDAAEELFVGIYTKISEALRRLAVQVKILLDITSVMDGPFQAGRPKSPPRSPAFPTLRGYLDGNYSKPSIVEQAKTPDDRQNLDVSSLLDQLVDVAQTQMTKILNVRREQTLRLPLVEFLRYFSLNRLFADECEVVSGRPGTALKATVNGHIKDFAARLGETKRQALAEGMDADQWDAADFGEDENQALQRIVESSTKDAEVWIKQNKINSRDVDDFPADAAKHKMNGIKPDSNLPNEQVSSSNPKDKIRRAVVDEEKFTLPHSAIIVVYGIEEFENFVAVIPSMNQDIASITLDYLKLFSSRLYQLILGTGATKSAGLKNITTKHLALAFQALSFISALIPYIREFVRRQPSPSAGLLVEFDKVKRLYQEHQTGIQEKLVEIMTGRSRTHVSAMKKLNWDANDNDDGNGRSISRSGVNAYMETLTKETMTLHRVLSKHLPDVAIQMVMEPIFANYRLQWGHAFQEIPIPTKEGKER